MKLLLPILTPALPRQPVKYWRRPWLAFGLALSAAMASAQDTATVPIELHPFESINDAASYGPFDGLFASIQRDNTAGGAPAPDYVVLRDMGTFEDASGAPFLFADFKGYADGFNLPDGKNAPSEMGGLIMGFSDLPEGFSESLVVGFLQASGTFSSAPKTSLGSFYEGATGEITYEKGPVRRDAEITIDTQNDGTLTGETRLIVRSSDQVEVEPWTSDIYSFEAPAFENLELDRFNNLYTGMMVRSDQPDILEWYDRIGLISLEDTSDTDEDDIPDFSDLGVTPAPFFAPMALSNNWYYSSWMESAVLPTPESWYLTTSHQWLYAPNGQTQGIWFYSPEGNLDWFWTREDLYPYLYRHSNGEFVYYQWEDHNGDRQVSSGEAYIYDYTQEEWIPLQF